MRPFEVNITAYKYANHPNSLIVQLRETLPDAFIRVWDNSPARLDIQGANEVRWNRFNPSLSRVWNWAIAQSDTPWVLVANDDIKLKKPWYVQLEEDFQKYPTALWHGPSRFYLFHKSLIDRVGWFDERMNGLTFEDLDYVRRMNHLQVPHRYGCESSLHRNAESLKDQVDRPNRSGNNQVFFNSKYANDNMEEFNDIPLFATPDFYPNRRDS